MQSIGWQLISSAVYVMTYNWHIFDVSHFNSTTRLQAAPKMSQKYYFVSNIFAVNCDLKNRVLR